MGVIESQLAAQIAKARARADGDIAALAAARRDQTSLALSADARRDRVNFLTASLGDPAAAESMLERIILGNELQPVSYLQRGALAARAVARIAIRSMLGSGWGTGFLISPQVLLTNNHVLPDRETARGSAAHFQFETDLADQPIGPTEFALDPDTLFVTSAELDFSAVAVRPRSADGAMAVDAFGFLPLLGMTGKVADGEWLTIVQHPAGERKQLCVRENRLLKRTDVALWYSTDTLAGSSGSPVFNNDWFVVALHHSGIPEEKNGRMQTVDGRDYDPATMPDTQIKWIANEGIRASRIADELHRTQPNHPLLRPMFEATPQSARIQAVRSATPPMTGVRMAAPSDAPLPRPRENDAMPAYPMDIRVRIEADGSARVLSGQESMMGPAESAGTGAAERTAALEVPFDDDYGTRTGYRADFLGRNAVVDLPAVGPGMKDEIAHLVVPGREKEFVLHYHNYSLVMHAKRRLALYSAANIDFSGRFDLARPADVWRRDPRIKREHQLEGFYYANNQFDRGHLTRREDLEFGKTRLVALQSAADTCHWTNCTPQHRLFNQGKTVWQGIERYILENTIETDQLKAQVITGPVLDEGDPDYRKIQYPVQFWKVVVALDEAGEMFATAYIAGQAEIIAQHGIEAAPFGAFRTFQTTVAEIERLTGLAFKGKGKKLSDFDPLQKRPRRSTRRARGAEEAAGMPPAPEGYFALGGVDDIVTR